MCGLAGGGTGEVQPRAVRDQPRHAQPGKLVVVDRDHVDRCGFPHVVMINGYGCTAGCDPVAGRLRARPVSTSLAGMVYAFPAASVAGAG